MTNYFKDLTLDQKLKTFELAVMMMGPPPCFKPENQAAYKLELSVELQYLEDGIPYTQKTQFEKDYDVYWTELRSFCQLLLRDITQL